jgi:hypothetical protein
MDRFRLVVLAVVLPLGLAPGVRAQVDPDEVFPLAVGNVWEFTDDTYNNGTVRWEVVGEQTTGGVTVPLLQTGAAAPCAVRTDAAPGGYRFRLVDPADLGASCAAAGAYPGFHEGSDGFFSGYSGAEPETVSIGGTAVTATAWTVAYVPGGSAPSTGDGYRVLEGIGPVLFVRNVDPSGAPPYTVFGYELTYARIDRVEYGMSTAAEDGPAGGALGLSVGPNPAGARGTVRFTLAEAAAVRVEVVDALGRAVRTVDVGPRPAGAGAVAVETGGLAPGVYVVRVVAGAVSASVRLVVR